MLKSYLIVFFISMLPLIELRGAIPVGIGMGLPILPTYLVCVVGNMLPVPFIYLFARKVLIWGYHKPIIGPFCRFCIVKGEKGGRALEAKAGRGLVAALLLFVGIPLPGMDRHAGRVHPRHEVQRCAHRLHGRRAAGRDHHGPGKRRSFGSAERSVCGVRLVFHRKVC